MSLCCKLISYFVIFAVLVLRFYCSRLVNCNFFINICCFGGMYWASLGIFKVHIKQPSQTYHSASAYQILSKLDHGATALQFYFFVWLLWFCWYEKVEIYLHTKFLRNNSIHRRYYYFRFLKTNVRHVGILPPVPIFTFASPSACHSASACQISSKSD